MAASRLKSNSAVNPGIGVPAVIAFHSLHLLDFPGQGEAGPDELLTIALAVAK
jgi:hypothetical protein